jgi:hypothetical protein
MVKKCSMLVALFWGINQALAQSVGSIREVVQALEKADKTSGVQVGLVVNAHDGTGASSVYAEVITLKPGTHTAYDALEKSSVTKVYHPQYNEPPDVFVLSLMGKQSDKTSDGKRTWAFFVASKGKSEWVLSKEGVARTPVSDGSLIGFSRTAWSQKGESYKTLEDPGSLKP